jgi:hypothetical protein
MISTEHTDKNKRRVLPVHAMKVYMGQYMYSSSHS